MLSGAVCSPSRTSNALKHQRSCLLVDFYKLRRASKDGGIATAIGWECGASWRNTCMLKRDKESAIAFSLPGTCFAITMNLNRAAHKKSSLNSCIRRVSLAVPDEITATTLWLSQQNWIRRLRHLLPHTWHAMTIGRSSLYAILNGCWIADQEPLNHSHA